MSWLFALALLLCPPAADREVDHFEVDSARSYRIGDLPIDVSVEAVDAGGDRVETVCGAAAVTGLHRIEDGERVPVTRTPPLVGGRAVLEDVVPEGEVAVHAGDTTGAWTPDLRQLPGFLSILPPIMAVVLAILLRQALIALFAGVWLGALFIHGFNPLSALVRSFDTYLPATVGESGHPAIILFTMALGGMVGIVSKSGGTAALVSLISRRAKTRRSGMLTAWFGGLVVFFDDYANCLLVGNTVRPFTDKLKISREKLSYIVDSTAAPVATVALISTWIGYQLGLLDDVFGEATGGGAYDLFLSLLPYSFYSFLTLGFVVLVAATGRDFGPMRRAELRARERGELLRPGAQPLMDRELTEMAPETERSHWLTAVIPVVSVIAIVIVGLYVSGAASAGPDAGLREVIAAADSYAVLLWASFGGSVIAAVTALAMRTITVPDAVDAWVGGVKAMVMAVLILVLAWAIGSMCKDHLDTGPWLLSQVSPSAHFLPVITFLVSAAIALATGSSFSTMAIVIPIAGPMAWALTGDASGLDAGVVESIRFATLASVLSGAVFGDHCSPISDTTIMSSMSSAADHVDHVRTQIPYASVCATVAALAGFIPAGYGISPLISLPIGFAVLAGVLMIFGRKGDR